MPLAADALTPLLPACFAEAERRSPEEACGAIVRGAGGLRFVAIPNVSPAPRSDTFAMDPVALLAAVREAEAEGGGLCVLVHSHPDGPARLSMRDREQSLAAGEPLWPGVDLLVIALRDGRCKEARLYRWDAASSDFIESASSRH